MAAISCLAGSVAIAPGRATATPSPTSCAPTLAGSIASTSSATQLVTVVAPTASSTSASLMLFTKVAGCWRSASGSVPARIGKAGLSRTKHEGDGATPAGLFGFASTMYGNHALAGTTYPYRHLRCGDWWDEDSASQTYNEFVEVPCAESNPPFNNGSSEALWRSPVAYAMFAVIAYNTARVAGRGSAIFLHVDGGGPTTGCVAISVGALGSVLKWLRPSAHPLIAIGTPSTITAY